jgi:hypothetical protein
MSFDKHKEIIIFMNLTQKNREVARDEKKPTNKYVKQFKNS